MFLIDTVIINFGLDKQTPLIRWSSSRPTGRKVRLLNICTKDKVNGVFLIKSNIALNRSWKIKFHITYVKEQRSVIFTLYHLTCWSIIELWILLVLKYFITYMEQNWSKNEQRVWKYYKMSIPIGIPHKLIILIQLLREIHVILL